MKTKIDLTKEKFDKVDFSEAKIVDFYCQKNIPTDLKFSIWGGTLWLERRWDNHRPQFTENELLFRGAHNTDMYVSGMGTITVTRLAGGYIEISPYSNTPDPCGNIVFAHNADDSLTTYKRSWNMGDIKNCDEYLWELSMAWPPASCILYLYCNNGTVNYEFNDDDLIDANLYIQQARKYSYNEDVGHIDRPIPRALQNLCPGIIFDKSQKKQRLE